jgi:hypothetical protein
MTKGTPRSPPSTPKTVKRPKGLLNDIFYRSITGTEPGKGLVSGDIVGRVNGNTNGRTNGRTNGKVNGRVNGLVNGRSNGLVNGHSKGRINGRINGLTNGRVLSRINGLTNGRTNGRINGRTNGRINGAGVRHGLVNGVTNGRRNGRVNGLVNGFVNGAGAVNGFRLSYQQRSVDPRMPRLKRKLPIIAALVVLLIAIPYALVYTFPEEEVEIDGYFMDWLTAQIYDDVPDSSNPDISISSYAMKHSPRGAFLYLKTAGSMFQGREGGADGFYLFVDRDGNPRTGYSVRGLGAEAMVSLIGWNGSLKQAIAYTFNPWASKSDFGGFFAESAPAIAFRGSELELFASIGVSDRSKVAICAKHTWTPDDWSEVNFGRTGPALEVVQYHDAPEVTVGWSDEHALSMGVSVKGPRAFLEGMNFDFLGNVTPEAITLVEGQRMIASSGNGTIALARPMTLEPDSPRTFEVLATLPSGSLEGTFGLRLNASEPLLLTTDAPCVLRSVQTGAMISYIGAAPGRISIDGAFGDWEYRPPYQDELCDLYEDDCWLNMSGNADIDVAKLASSDVDASFFMSVNGTMLGGASVPKAIVRWAEPIAPPIGNVTGQNATGLGIDYAMVMIDTDANQSTGFEVGGAETSIVVAGKNGNIIYSRIYAFVGGSWSMTGDAGAALDGYRLELGASYEALGIQLGETYVITMFTQDWCRRTDCLDVALPARAITGTREFGGIIINEVFSKVPPKKTEDWIEVYNTGTEPINLDGWELLLDGVLYYTFPDVTLDSGELFVTTLLNFGTELTFELYDDEGNLIDSVTLPGVTGQSYGRIGTPEDGYVNWSTMKPSPGQINDGQVPIPEFGSLLLPLAIVPITFFAIMRLRKKSRPLPQEQSPEDVN